MAVADQPVPGLEVLQQALTWPEKANAVLVTDAPSYVAASELLLAIKALRKEADDTFNPIIADAHRAHQTACAQKRKIELPLTEAERTIKNRLVAFDEAQEERRRQEQRRIEDEARRQAETEALERAAALEQEGREYGDHGLVTEAHQLVEEAIQAPAPPVPLVPKATPRVAGITYVTRWTGQCVNMPALIKHCAAHPEHAHLLQVNQSALTSMARAMRDGLNKIPGVRAIETKDVAAGGR
jgi:hypothetical protein